MSNNRETVDEGALGKVARKIMTRDKIVFDRLVKI